jgi:hypothetical protein
MMSADELQKLFEENQLRFKSKFDDHRIKVVGVLHSVRNVRIGDFQERASLGSAQLKEKVGFHLEYGTFERLRGAEGVRVEIVGTVKVHVSDTYSFYFINDGRLMTTLAVLAQRKAERDKLWARELDEEDMEVRSGSAVRAQVVNGRLPFELTREGQILEVTGIVASITEAKYQPEQSKSMTREAYCLRLGPLEKRSSGRGTDPDSGVRTYFDPRHKEMLLNLKVGQAVRLRGRWESRDGEIPGKITGLWNCQLVKAD